MKKDDFGTRMKSYEGVETEAVFIPNMPLYARLDGRAFHSFCRGLDKPFDEDFMGIMRDVTIELLDASNADLAYTQSDEISLAWLDSSKVFFERKKFKIISTLASIASAKFMQSAILSKEIIRHKVVRNVPTFDCRVFNLPNEVELANMFVWREKDASRNSISMLAQANFSHKSLQNKSSKEMQEMLFSEKGINYNDIPSDKKRGTYFKKDKIIKEATQEMILKSKGKLKEGDTVIRSIITVKEFPKMGSADNKVGVYFYDEQPKGY